MTKIRIALICSALTFAGIAIGLQGYACTMPPEDLAPFESLVRDRFPRVSQLSTQELADWMQDSSTQPILFDVRGRNEFQISHLQNARHIPPGSSASVIDLPKETLIITYCSVGYRSSDFATRLMDAGYTNVHNLEGSIFRWANEGRPVYRGPDRVYLVHPYNETWGALLDKSFHP